MAAPAPARKSSAGQKGSAPSGRTSLQPAASLLPRRPARSSPVRALTDPDAPESTPARKSSAAQKGAAPGGQAPLRPPSAPGPSRPARKSAVRPAVGGTVVRLPARALPPRQLRKRAAAARTARPARPGRQRPLVLTESALLWGLLYDLLCAPVWLANLARGRARLGDAMRPVDRVVQFVLSARMTTLLILLNLLVFAVELYAKSAGWRRAAFVAAFTLSTDGLGRGEHLPLLTHFFAHADLMHLGGNMLALFVFGRVVERNLGPWRLLGCYLLAAACATALSLLCQGLSGRSVPTLGASGAVAGLVALGILLEPLSLTFEALVPMPLFLVGWLAIAADFAALFGRGGPVSSAVDSVDHPAHLGGYLSVLLGYGVLKRQQQAQARLGLLINLATLLLMAGLWFLL